MYDMMVCITGRSLDRRETGNSMNVPREKKIAAQVVSHAVELFVENAKLIFVYHHIRTVLKNTI